MKAAPILLLLITLAPAPARSEELRAAAVLQDALEHSYARRLSLESVDAAAAREAQALAVGRVRFDVGARASQFEGLESSTLGAFTVPELDQRIGAFAALTQPVYTGGRVRSQREAERFARQAAESSREAVTAGVALEALRTYWGWSRAVQSLATAGAFVDRMQTLYDELRHQREAGMVTENDLLATEVERERARARLETARQEVELAKAQIGFLTGTPVRPDATPEVAPDPGRQVLAGEEELIATALQNRPERAARAREVDSAEARIRVQQADRAPSLNLRAGYDYANPNPYFFPPADEWNDDLYAGVEMSWNLWDSKLTRSRVAEAAALRMQAELLRDRTDEEIALQVRTARIRLQEVLNLHQVAVRAQDSARRNLQSSQALLKNGLARNSDVLDAQARLADADDAVVAAVSEVAVGRAFLDYACGTLQTGEGQP